MTDYNNLDLHVIKERIGEFASIAEAKSFILSEEVSFNPLKIRKNAKETAEFLDLLNRNESFSFDGIYNVDALLQKADKNIMLSGIELKNILVFHNHCNRIKKQFTKYDPELSIRDYSDSLNINEEIFRQIENCIDNSGEVKDDASDKLKSINRELEACEKDLYNRAHSFIDRHMGSLQETSIYLRNDRITFLIKSSDKNKYQGYTYGSSSSGLAYYVEPQSFIEGNNRKISLMHDREDEIVRILQHLSYLVASISEQYSYNFECLLNLCVIYAKARYGYSCNGIIGDLCEGEYFSFSDLCHPLIDPKKVVSNSYRLYAPYQGIVISGSNTGGKTVSLKAIGLSILMTYLGMPIIASKAEVPIYKDIFVDIDDNQSIEDSLSTFSAHISNINSILKNADERSLILIDELISGTDPKEAQAISLAILDKIKELGSKFIITTHFDDIKNYSYKDEEILLSSVGFNMETLTPTYRYLEDSVGSSNALEIASRYIDDPDLIENAKNYLVKNKSEQEELLDKLSKQIEENEILKDELNVQKKEYEDLHKQYQDKLSEFEAAKEKLKADYEKKLNDELSDILSKANEKLDDIKDNKEEAKKIVTQIEELKTEDTKEEKVEFSVGDNVRIKDNEQIGVISAINNDTVTIAIRGLTVKAKLNDLTLMPKIKKQETRVISKSYKRVPGEINLVGERVEDGLVMMEEYLDKANASHMSTVKVIHGIGTGMLRTALRNRMKKLSYVKSFKDGDYYDGGSAVTIVEFK
ncbi:MAG: Smr/MutS family protein [Erysipelotrichaceae bacterium]|nr:Smr/MutS family protein [Erysipelotrichaceae bacterium]